MTAVLPRARPRVHAALGDAELMALLQAGVAAAFVVLYHRHARTVFSLAHRIVGDRAVAEDVTQDAFIGLWQHRHDYAPERGAARTWLLAIARHRAIDLTRRRSRRDEPLDGAHAEREAPERTDEEVLRRSEATALGEAVRGLPAAQRDIIALVYHAGLSQAEIAARLALPLGTVKSRVRLGLRKLSGRLPAA